MVAFELVSLAWDRRRAFNTSFLRSFLCIFLGGMIIAAGRVHQLGKRSGNWSHNSHAARRLIGVQVSMAVGAIVGAWMLRYPQLRPGPASDRDPDRVPGTQA